MRDQVTMMAMALMHGLVLKTGGFGTDGDVKRAFDTAELMYTEALKREPKWHELQRKAEKAAWCDGCGKRVVYCAKEEKCPTRG